MKANLNILWRKEWHYKLAPTVQEWQWILALLIRTCLANCLLRCTRWTTLHIVNRQGTTCIPRNAILLPLHGRTHTSLTSFSLLTVHAPHSARSLFGALDFQKVLFILNAYNISMNQTANRQSKFILTYHGSLGQATNMTIIRRLNEEKKENENKNEGNRKLKKKVWLSQSPGTRYRLQILLEITFLCCIILLSLVYISRSTCSFFSLLQHTFLIYLICFCVWYTSQHLFLSLVHFKTIFFLVRDILQKIFCPWYTSLT